MHNSFLPVVCLKFS